MLRTESLQQIPNQLQDVQPWVKGNTVLPEADSDAIGYLETRDPELLSQYADIRESSYQEYLGMEGFDGRLDNYDLISDIVLAVKGNEVLGGARITACDPLHEKILPMEEPGFFLKELLPELRLDKYLYGEYSRLAFKPEYRNGEYSASLYDRLNNISQMMGLKYIFAIAPITQARSYKNAYKKFFDLDIEIRRDIKVPYKEIYKDIKSEIVLSILTL